MSVAISKSRCPLVPLGVLLSALTLGACGDPPAPGKESPDLVLASWSDAKLSVEFEEPAASESFTGGVCRKGTVAKLHVELCEFKDVLAADTAKDKGLAQLAGTTGVSLVRDRYLLILADRDKVDVHGKTVNKVAKLFLSPPGSQRNKFD